MPELEDRSMQSPSLPVGGVHEPAQGEQMKEQLSVNTRFLSVRLITS